MSDDMERVGSLLDIGAETLERTPTDEVVGGIGALPVGEAVTKAEELGGYLGVIRTASSNVTGTLIAVDSDAKTARVMWDMALKGARAPEAVALLAEARSLTNGPDGARALFERSMTVRAKLGEVERLHGQLVTALGELAALQQSWHGAAGQLQAGAARAAANARALSQSWTQGS